MEPLPLAILQAFHIMHWILIYTNSLKQGTGWPSAISGGSKTCERHLKEAGQMITTGIATDVALSHSNNFLAGVHCTIRYRYCFLTFRRVVFWRKVPDYATIQTVNPAEVYSKKLPEHFKEVSAELHTYTRKRGWWWFICTWSRLNIFKQPLRIWGWRISQGIVLQVLFVITEGHEHPNATITPSADWQEVTMDGQLHSRILNYFVIALRD